MCNHTIIAQLISYKRAWIKANFVLLTIPWRSAVKGSNLGYKV